MKSSTLRGTVSKIFGKRFQKQAVQSTEDSLSCGDLIMTAPTAIWRDISLRVDLYNSASQYLNFLWRCRHHEEFIREDSLRVILHRYEHFWLPLLAEWQQTDLEPPLDIQWVWHLHMLVPAAYAQYCKDKFSRILPHRVRLTETSTRDAVERTRIIWKDNYPTEPYDLDVKTARSVPLNGTKLRDLLALAAEQKHFLYQVSLPHYKDVNFLFRAVDRYKQLLLLKRQKPRITIKLPVDIQLMWRVHLLHPVEYMTEIQRILGPYAMESLGDSAYDVHLMLISDSNDLWRSFYQEPLFVNGTGFRGLELREEIKELPTRLYANTIIDCCEITIDDLCISDLWSKDKKVIIEGRRLGDSSFQYHQFFKVEGMSGKVISSQNHRGLAIAEFDAKYHRGLEFHIYSKKGALCTTGELHLTTVFYNPHKGFDNKSFITSTVPVEVPKISYTDPKLTFNMKVKAAVPQPHVISMDRDPFVPGPVPNELRRFVDCLPAWVNAINEQQDLNEFTIAKHRLKSKRGMLAFGVHIVRNDDAQLNGFMLYHNNVHLVCVAHTIGTEQLPAPEQVHEMNLGMKLTYDVDEGDQAMVLRNHLGDWAICVARWHVINAATGEGHVMIRVMFLQSNTQAEYNIRDDELQNIQCGQVSIDMPTGKLYIDASCQELAEHITLAFCVGMLFVTCQRRSLSVLPLSTPNGSVRSVKSHGSEEAVLSDVPREAPNKRSFSRFSAKAHLNRKKLTKRRKMSASFTFLLASGLQIDVAVSGSVGHSRSASRSSSYSRSSVVGSGGHVNVTSINFNQTPSQKQIEDQVSRMITQGGNRYYEGSREYYTGKPEAVQTFREEEKYWDVRL